MRGVNRVMLIGNLGKDPDVQFPEGNIAVAKFSLLPKPLKIVPEN
jgi:single-strand DNA-binding protein